MSNININKIKNLDSIGATREIKVNGAGKTEMQNIAKKSVNNDKDTLNFSNRVSEFGKLVDTLREMPDVRQERVEVLKAKISAGEYNPSGEEIAEAIFNDEKLTAVGGK